MIVHAGLMMILAVSTHMMSIPAGRTIAVVIQNDIGSRHSRDGDRFAVKTVQDFYYRRHLILPRGSAGYGFVTHVKGARRFHGMGQLSFIVTRLITPSHRNLWVTSTTPTADAPTVAERNGSLVPFAKRGNDVLIKTGTVFHVSTLRNYMIPFATRRSRPTAVDTALLTQHR